MGFDNECILNIQSLKGEYFCPVCRLLVYPNEAMQTQCSHLYCKPCLTYVVRTTQACPYDGYLVSEADSKPLVESNKALADTIGKISVHCLFHRSGCTWQGQLTDCTAHCSGCAYGNSPVVCNRCGIQLVHSQVQEHAQTCSGVPAQAQQPENGQGASGTAATGPSSLNQTVAPAATPASQVQTSQASVAPLAGQNSTQQVNPATQVHSAQAATLTSEQWYQQQQQYQQYYQQYPGYDPYQQQQYQQYYPYQQYQQPAQQPASQIPVQHQPHPQSQFPTQQQVQPSHTPQQLQQLSQAPLTAQPQPHPPQATTIIQQQIPPAVQPQTLQNPVAYSMPHSQPQPYSHPQTITQGVPQQGMQMPQYQQNTSQMQLSHPQVQTQPYPQAHSHQPHHYQHPQGHMLPQIPTHPHPNNQNNAQPPPHPIQPTNNATQLRPQQSSGQAVTGYHSYPQPQPPQQTQGGAPHAAHMTAPHQQPLNSGQVQGQFPQKPPNAPVRMPNQQPSMVPSAAQHPGAPVSQVPVYPQSQHQGYPAQLHSGMQPAQHPPIQPQGFPGHGPYLQQQPAMQASLRAPPPSLVYQQNNAQAPFHPNAAQNYQSRPPMISHGGGQQPYSQAPGHANAGRMLQPQLSTNQPSVNQSNSSLPVHGQIGTQNIDKGKQGQYNGDVGNLASMGTQSAEMNKSTFADNKKGPSDTSNTDSNISNPRFENGALQEGNLKIKEDTLSSSTEPLSTTKSADLAKNNHKENEQPSDKAFGAASHLRPSPQKRTAGLSLPHSIPGQLRPQVPAQMHPSSQPFGMNNNAQLQFLDPGRRPGSIGLPQGNFDQSKFPGGPVLTQPPNHMERLPFSDGRQPELHPPGPMERGPFRKPSSLHGLQDDRLNMLPEEHMKPFPTDRSFEHREFEGDHNNFSRPSHLDGGTPAKFGSRFPPPGPLDQSPHMFGDRLKPVGFHDASQGRPDYPDFMRPGLEFGHRGMDSLAARSPGRDFRGVPGRGFGGFPGGMDESNIYSREKVIYENIPGRVQRGEYGQDMLHGHSRRGEHFGAFGGRLEMGEPHFPGSVGPPRPFGEAFGREMPGYAHHPDPGFRSGFHHQRYADEGGFCRGEMELFHNARKRKPGSIMCRICNVDCETVEGLDLHSQTREHQKTAMDMVISIKQNSKKQKVSNDRSSFEEGRKPRASGYDGRGRKR